MARHLSRKDYTEMPWANGGGTTIEILRKAAADGTMLWRFSTATVAQDGPFSQLPEIERNLTVIDGPGFDLVGDSSFRADPLQPVAFPGDVLIAARNVTGVTVDFNVMTSRALPRPKVELVESAVVSALPRATLCIFALGQAQYGDTMLARHDFVIGAKDARISGAPALAIHLFENT